MSKQIRVSDPAAEYIEEEAKANHRSIIADQVDAIIAELKDWRRGIKTVSFDEGEPVLFIERDPTPKEKQ